MLPLHVLIDPTPRSGAWNMAVDEALLESAVEGRLACVRWYQWDAATLSLGYFQATDESLAQPDWVTLPVVRRLSGGGAILHQHELTYSCALPPTHPRTVDPFQLYLDVHGALIQVLRGRGYDVQLRGSRFGKEGAGEAFLCFSRGDEMDVVLGPHKVLGSAQRRRKGAVLQHGSLVLRRSPYAPQFPGLFDLGGEMDVTLLRQELVEAMKPVLGQEFITETLDSKILFRAQQLHDERYTTLDWSRKNPLQPQ